MAIIQSASDHVRPRGGCARVGQTIRGLIAAVLAYALGFAATGAHAQSDAERALVAQLNAGTAFAMMRHALAPGTGDPGNFDVNDCSTQRNLNDTGRNQARDTGAYLKKLGLERASVFSSAWCRCQDTAKLLDLGPVTTLAPLNSFFQRYANREPQTQAMRTWLASDKPDGPVMLVTHQVNIRALTGSFTSSGEIVVAKRDGDGAITVLGTIAPR